MDKFLFCINQQFQEAEETQLPKHFCPDCNIKISSSYTFIQHAKETNETLLRLILQSGEIKNELYDNENNEYLATDDLEIKDEVKTNYSDDSLIGNTEDLKDIYNDEHGHYDMSKDNYISKNKPDTLKKKSKTRVTPKKTLFKNIQDLKVNNNKIENGNSKGVKTVVPEITNENNSKEAVTKTSNINSELSCKMCKKTYKHLTFLKKHCRLKHGNKSETKIKSIHIEKLKVLDNNKKKQCPKCNKSYKLQNCLSKHLLQEHSTDLNSMKQYVCPYCTLIFTSNHSLRYHKQKEHIEDRRFGCNACDKRFRLHKQLAVHALTHSEQRPFICDTCHMSFKMKQVLIKHVTTHENDRPHLCDICAMSFKRAGTLKEHMLTHAGPRSLSCHACAFTCVSRTTLLRHALRHAGARPHACPHCAKAFYDKPALDRHIRIHTGEKPYKCPRCDLAFVDHWKRKIHIMRVHNVPFEEIPRLAADGQPLNKW
ncbi:hypothetical protein O0L34_g12836 [Tuta absoluta]|nr:hypothetical protein O0L34_g12836 [Tuta absoluta]